MRGDPHVARGDSRGGSQAAPPPEGSAVAPSPDGGPRARGGVAAAVLLFASLAAAPAAGEGPERAPPGGEPRTPAATVDLAERRPAPALLAPGGAAGAPALVAVVAPPEPCPGPPVAPAAGPGGGAGSPGTCLWIVVADAGGTPRTDLGGRPLRVKTRGASWTSGSGLEVRSPDPEGGRPVVARIRAARAAAGIVPGVVGRLGEAGIVALTDAPGRPVPGPPRGSVPVLVDLSHPPEEAGPEWGWNAARVRIARGAEPQTRVGPPDPGWRAHLLLPDLQVAPEAVARALAPLRGAFRVRVPAVLPPDGLLRVELLPPPAEVPAPEPGAGGGATGIEGFPARWALLCALAWALLLPAALPRTAPPSPAGDPPPPGRPAEEEVR